ncbi:MAG: hypothetical protein CL933_20105 [Deltaproteobacteria bacterium]|nr:hypothetical protein [Deltaproteobacteria bacterium]
MTESLSQEERRNILDGLENSDEEVRRLSVERLLLLPAEESAERLVRCLGDSGWRVRKAAVERLVACRKDEAVQERLVASLADGENSERRNAASEVLVACGTRVTAALVTQLSSRDVDVRKHVVDVLAAIGDPESRVPLRDALADDDPNVRAAAAEALGVVGGADEITHLLGLATQFGEDVRVRLSALRALSRLEASVEVTALGDVLDQPLLCPAAYGLLGSSTDPQAVEALIKGLSSGSRSNREGAMGALLRTLGCLDGDEASRLIERLRAAATENEHLVESACDRLEVADLGSRMMLVQFLGLLEDPRAVVPILRAGRDDAIEELADRTLEALSGGLVEALEASWSEIETDLLPRAYSILGRAEGDVAERLLADALGSNDVQLRCSAAGALGRGGFFDRLPDLVRRLEMAARDVDADADEEVAIIVRSIVAMAEHSEAVGTGIDVQLIEVLSSRLAGAVEPVRRAIAQVLARLGREQDEDVIGYLLKDESAAVRRAAVEALDRFGFDRTRDALRLALGDEASSVRIAAANVLGRSNSLDASEILVRQLADDDPRVVCRVVRSVGHLCRTLGVADAEIERLIGPCLDEEAMVALASLEALTEVGGGFAGRLAVEVLTRPEPEVVRAAIVCIGAHGNASALVEILPHVSHTDWSVRAEVVQVLSDRAVRKGLPDLLRRLEVEEDAFVRESILRAVERLEE